MKRWMLRFGALLLVLAVGGFLVAASGIIPIKASSRHWPITKWFLRFGMERSMATHSFGIQVPELGDPDLVLKGAGHFDIGCRSCHGSPGNPRPRIAQHMMPQPPDLVPRIRESSARRLFYVVKHGMKFTGMPAWPSQQRDDEVWAMVAFLLKLPELDEAGYERLVRGTPIAASPMEAFAPPASLPAEPAAVVQSCAACHGRDGRGRGSGAFPKLAGQREEYLRNALAAYARGERHSGIMEPIAAGLDDEVMRELARYYASISAEAPTASAAKNAEAIARGRQIALEGIRSQRVPSCVECHGPKGTRTKPAYPSLAGLAADYLVLQLELFKKGQRGGSAYAHLMEPVVSRLEAEQMRDVALYLESLPPSGETRR